jgi:purine-binding chemotaxis protein CheW
METIEATDRTCIVVVEIEKDDSLHPIGVVVDAVSEVLFIKDENIEDTMHFGTNVDNHFITGMAKTENGVKILLDIDRLMSGDDVSEILEAA